MKQNGKVTHISDLKFDEQNPRRHNPRNIGMVVNSLQEVGFARSIVIDEDNNILAGNGVTEAATLAGIEKVVEIEGDGNTIIAVRRRGLSAEAKQKLKYFDNRASDLAEWDVSQLLADYESGLDLTDLWSDQEMAALLEGAADGLLGEGGKDAEPQIDKAAELQKQWGTAVGQVWELGAHRLTVGDCTDRAVVEAVMRGERAHLSVTDPPYMVNYDPQWRIGLGGGGSQDFANGKVIQNDDSLNWIETFSFLPADVLYCWTADKTVKGLQVPLEQFGFELAYMIIWNKDLAVFGRGDYHHKYEPCLYMVRKGKNHNWNGDRKQETVWDIPTIHSFANGHNSEEWGLLGHGNQKPIECMARPIRNNSTGGQLIYDPFLGSGTTLIACQNLKRRCRAIEIDPGYAAVSLQRFFDATGIEPKLL